MPLREVCELFHLIAVLPDCNLVLSSKLIQELATGACHLYAQQSAQCLSAATKLHEQPERYRRVLNLNRRVMLSNVILVHHKIVAPDVWDEVAVEILYKQLQSRHVSDRIKVDLCLLSSLLALEQRHGRPAGNSDLSAGWPMVAEDRWRGGGGLVVVAGPVCP